jgi:L-lactate dehydrogenase complex protein LldG
MNESSRRAILARTGSSDLDAAMRDYGRIAEVSVAASDGVPAERFAHRVREYGAAIETLSESALVGWVADRLRQDGLKRTLVGPGSAWSSEDWAVPDEGRSNAALDEIGGALVEAAGAIADTGTVILDGRADDARRALSLIPDKLICVVRVETIYASLEEWWQLSEPDRPITLISGPSATSDIELNRVVGVHGPRQLHVVVLR